MFGNIVLDIGENTLLSTTAENSKSVSWNVSLKAAWYFYIFMAKKAYCNYRATRAPINYSFKIKMNNFNNIFFFQVKVLTDYKNTFILTRSLVARTISKSKTFFFRAGVLLNGVSLSESSELFQNLYKDIRPKAFCISAKFAKMLILF